MVTIPPRIPPHITGLAQITPATAGTDRRRMSVMGRPDRLQPCNLFGAISVAADHLPRTRPTGTIAVAPAAGPPAPRSRHIRHNIPPNANPIPTQLAPIHPVQLPPWELYGDADPAVYDVVWPAEPRVDRDQSLFIYPLARANSEKRNVVSYNPQGTHVSPPTFEIGCCCDYDEANMYDSLPFDGQLAVVKAHGLAQEEAYGRNGAIGKKYIRSDLNVKGELFRGLFRLALPDPTAGPGERQVAYYDWKALKSACGYDPRKSFAACWREALAYVFYVVDYVASNPVLTAPTYGNGRNRPRVQSRNEASFNQWICMIILKCFLGPNYDESNLDSLGGYERSEPFLYWTVIHPFAMFVLNYCDPGKWPFSLSLLVPVAVPYNFSNP